MSQSLANQIMQFAAEQANVPVDGISLDTHFVNDLGFDSLDLVEFTMKLEDEFSIGVPDTQAQELKSVRDVVNFVEEQIRDSAGSVH